MMKNKINKIVCINSFNDLHNIAMTYSKSGTVFRGHKKSEYQLIPKIARYKKFQKIETLLKEEKYMLNLFKRYSIPYLDYKPKNDFEWLASAQHHGLPTRLLDWTRNPLVAAFFAVEENHDGDSSFYIYTNSSHLKINDELNPLNLKKSVIKYIPDHFNDRIVAQSGLFTIHKNPLEEFNDKNLKKIIISNACRKDLKKTLYRYGIHRGSLFPGLDGLSKHIEYLRTEVF